MRRTVGWVLLIVGFVLGAVVMRIPVSMMIQRREVDPSADVAAEEFWAWIVGASWMICLVAGGLLAADKPLHEIRRAAGLAGRLPGRLAGWTGDLLAWLRAEDRAALAVRRALYFGSFGALAATAGWFVWVAVAILAAKAGEVGVSAVVGGVVGLALEGVRRYWHVMRAQGSAAEPRRRALAVLVPVSSAVGVFLAVAGENSLAELIKEVRFPFLLSVLTFFVGGVTVMVVSMLVRRWDGFLLGLALFVLGWLVAPVPLLVLNRLTGVSGDYGAVAAWWTLITVIASLVVVRARRSAWRAVPAAAVAVVVIVPLMLLAGFRPLELDAASAVPQGRPVMYAAVDIVEGLLSAPDVPAQAWSAAQRQLRAGGSVELIEPGVAPGAARWLADLGGCADIPVRADADNPARYLARKRELCRQITAATGSGWTRSLIVIGFFCAGLSLASRLERRWRPENYTDHPIRRFDRAVIIAGTVGLAMVILIIRFVGIPA